VHDYAALDRIVHDGLPFAVVRAMMDTGRVSLAEIKAYVVPRGMIGRRIKSRALSVAESVRAERLARVVATAEEVFGDAGKAHRWMRSGLPELDGRTALEVAATELGARSIETMLWEIAYGLPA
jgi:putative toxin-antitoxin system antitoxin component (TIGR02293 family)